MDQIAAAKPKIAHYKTDHHKKHPINMSLIGISSNEIFIVDDDATICDLLAMAFTVEGYHVTRFRDGSSFIASARKRTPACVLLDLFMPAKSGLDILKELDARNYSAPIFIMSGGGDIPTAVEAIKNGAYDFLEKQIGADAMVARVRQTIDGRSPLSGDPPSQSFAPCGRLTQRERDVLNQVIAAASSKEAARNLGISRRTVEIHRLHIMKKLGAKNAVDLVRMVLSNEDRPGVHRTAVDTGGNSVAGRAVTSKWPSEAEMKPPRGSQEAMFGAVFDSASYPIIAEMLDGTIMAWNSAAERLFQYTAAEAVGRNIDMIIPADRLEENRAMRAKALKGE